MKSTLALRSFLLGSSLLAAAPQLHATDYYWDNLVGVGFGTAGGTWTVPTIDQWNTDTSGTSAAGASITTATTDALFFGNAATTGLAAGTIAISGTVDSGNMTFASNSDDIVLSGGTINLAAASTVTVDNASGTLSSFLSGAGTSFTKDGSGTLTLSAVNTFSGSVAVNNGTLKGTAHNAFGTSNNTRTITVGSGATIDFNIFGVFGGHDTAAVPTLILNGGTATNTYSNGNNPLNNVTLNGGTLTATTSGGDQWRSWNINGTVTSTGTSTIEAGSAPNPGILLASGAFTNNDFDVQSDTLTISTPIANGRDTAGPYAARATSLTKLGDGTLTLSGINTFSGSVAVNNGTLKGTAHNAFGTSDNTRTITVGSGATIDFNIFGVFGGHDTAAVPTLILNGGTATNTYYNGNNPLNNVTLNGGTLTATTSGGDQWRSWNINGTVTSTGTSAIDAGSAPNPGILLASGAFTNNDFDVQSGTLTISTPIANGRDTGDPYAARATSLTKLGDGTLTLSGINTFSGSVAVNNGTLKGMASNAFGTSDNTRTITVGSGATIDFNVAGVFGGHDTAAVPTLILNGGTATNTGGNNPLNNITLNGGTLTATASGGNDWRSWNINGTVTSTGTSTIEAGSAPNPGILLASGASTNNDFDVQSGTLTVSTPIANGRDAAFPWAARATSLTKLGGGTLTLTSANTYTGDTTVSGGTLSLANAYLADASTVTVAPSAVLNLTHGATDIIGTLVLGANTYTSGTFSAATHSPFISGSGIIQVGATPADPFADWMSTNYPAIVSPNNQPGADPENDGIKNLMEYILQGGDPSVSTTGTLPTVNAIGANFVFTYFRRAAATGTTQTFEYGNNLSGWASVAIPGGAGVVVTPDAPVAGIERVVITVAKGVNTKLFGRLKVTQP